jgi:hypothetical protein
MSKNVYLVIGVVVLVLILFMVFKGGTSAPETEDELNSTPISVTLAAENNSGISGTATVADQDGKAKITVNVSGMTAEAVLPAHIHIGSCASLGGTKYPLSSLANGLSETILDVSVDQLITELPLAINLHSSDSDLSDSKGYVACGDITKPATDSSTEVENETGTNETDTTPVQE